jgi:hypothetical protein
MTNEMILHVHAVVAAVSVVEINVKSEMVDWNNN